MMEGNNYSLSDIAAITGENGLGGNASWLIILFVLIFGMGGWNNRGGGWNDSATQEILFGQQFQNLDNKLDRIGNGIADSTFALKDAITTEGRGAQKNIDDLRYEMSQGFCSVKANATENTQKILDVLAQNKIDSLQARINQLEMQNQMCGVVRYPLQTTYTSGANPFCNSGCGCNSNV